MAVVGLVVVVVVRLFPTSLPVSDAEEMRVGFYKDSRTYINQSASCLCYICLYGTKDSCRLHAVVMT